MVHVGGVSGKPDATQGWGGSRGLRAVQCDANPVRASVDLTFTARRSVVVDSWCVCDRPDVYEECRCHERSRILFTCRPFSGHFDPLLPLAAGGSLISRADKQMRPRSQRCGQINDRFTGAPALLREENPSPSAPSIDHVRNVNGAAHVTNLSTCPRLAPDLQPGDFALVAADGDSGVGFVRVDPDDHLHQFLQGFSLDETVVGTPTSDRVRAGSPLSSYTTARPRPDALRSQAKPAPLAGRRNSSNPTRPGDRSRPRRWHRQAADVTQ